MGNTLIVATTSYAGMGPYVANIVNCFNPDDPIYYFFCDYQDCFFKHNIKQSLHEKSFFISIPNTIVHKLRDLLPIKKEYHKYVERFCLEKEIKTVHFINGPGDRKLVADLQRKHIRSVSTVHDLHPHESKKEWYKELRFKIINYYLYKNLPYSDYLITNSKFQFKELVSKYGDDKNFFHSFPSLVTDIIANGRKVPAEISGLTYPFILFFGRIEEYKGISILLSAFLSDEEINKKYKLVIAGGGSLNNDDTDIVIKNKNIIFVNRYIEDSEVAYLYQHAKCVVYPYISATQSGVFSLAYYFKTPVVASDVDYFKGIIEESKSGCVFKKGSVDDLKEKLSIVLKVDQKDSVEKGRSYYDTFFANQSLRNALMDIYRIVGKNSIAFWQSNI